jgi:protein tyrosine phosphatase
MKNETTKKFGNYSLELLDEEANEWYIIRKFKLTPKKGTSTEPRTIHHYQFINWPGKF